MILWWVTSMDICLSLPLPLFLYYCVNIISVYYVCFYVHVYMHMGVRNKLKKLVHSYYASPDIRLGSNTFIY